MCSGTGLTRNTLLNKNTCLVSVFYDHTRFSDLFFIRFIYLDDHWEDAPSMKR